MGVAALDIVVCLAVAENVNGFIWGVMGHECGWLVELELEVS